MKNPVQIFLEPCCLKCYKSANDYFTPEPHGRQWALNNLWAFAKCDKCGEFIESPIYKLLKNNDEN